MLVSISRSVSDVKSMRTHPLLAAGVAVGDTVTSATAIEGAAVSPSAAAVSSSATAAVVEADSVTEDASAAVVVGEDSVAAVVETDSTAAVVETLSVEAATLEDVVGLDKLGASSTLSMTWITPLLAIMSAMITLASFTMTPESETVTVTDSPLRVSYSPLAKLELGASTPRTWYLRRL